MLHGLAAAGLIAAMAGVAYGQRIVFSDDMTSFPAGWTLGTDGFNPDTWTRKTDLWFSSPAAAKCTRNDTHNLDSTNHWMQHSIALRGDSTGVVAFKLWQVTEQGYDFLYFEYSTDGGLNWTTLWNNSSDRHYWDQVIVPEIPSNANAIRFRFHSDWAYAEEGAYIDDVVLYSVDSAQTLVWYDDMTNFPADWSLSGNDTWGPQSYRAHSPAIAAQCSGVDSGYNDYQDNRMARAVNLTHPKSAFLSYWLCLRAEEEFDYLYSEIGGHEGEELASHTGYFGWTHFVCNISRNWSLVDSVGFHFCSDLSNTDAGAYVDDVTVTDFTRMGIDLAVVDIVNSPLEADSGALVSFSARVRNNSAQSVATPIYFEVSGGNYRATVVTSEIPPGETVLVSSPDWKADVPGEYTLRCWSDHFGDTCRGNDAANGRITVATRDAAVIQVLAPAGHVGPGVVVPQAIVRNHGTVRTPVDVTFRIANVGYSQTVHLADGLPVRMDTTIQFPDWTVVIGQHTTRCSTGMAGDQIPGNNRIVDYFDAGQNDVSATRIVTPQGRLDTSTVVTPSSTVRNLGLHSVSFDVGFWINDRTGTEVYYRKSTVTNLGVGQSRTVTFEPWPKPHSPGRYTTRSSTNLADDWNPANDATRDSFVVFFSGWEQCASLPVGAKSKNIKDGGALCAGKEPTDVNDTTYVHAFKGNNRYEFYRYNTVTNTWVAKESIPAVNRLGKKKAVKRGSSLAYGTDGKIYATKGNNTLDLWQYNPLTGVWTQKADVPIGARACKEGTSSAAVKVGSDNYVYLLRGSATWDFYRYNTATDAWDVTLPTAPGGASGKAYKNGSSITYDGNDTIYCLKGSLNEFAAYSISAKTWEARDLLPFIAPPGTRKKKVKDGSGTAYAGQIVYALKGGGTDEFWLYRTDEHKWYVGPALPVGSKKVKGGGALVAAPDVDALYAFRGNNTRELWRHGLEADGYPLAANGEQKSVQGQSGVRSPQFAFSVTPNPFTSSGNPLISYSLPRAGHISLRLYDVTGKLMRVLAEGYHPAGSFRYSLLATRYLLAGGVYLLKFEAEGCQTTEKLVVE